MMRNEKRLIRALIVLIAMLLILVMANGRFEQNQQSQMTESENYPFEEENMIVVGFSQLGTESVWRATHTQSIQQALSKENGFFLQYENAKQKQENQIKAIRGFISQRVDYIVFAPLMEDGWETVLTEAKEAGIPVILVDRKISGAEDLYTTFIGSDMKEEGRQAGRWLEAYQRKRGRLNEPLRIVALTGTLGSTSQIGRSSGFYEIVSQHDNWEIIAQEYGDFTVVKGKEAMAKLLRQNQDIDVVVSQNDEMTFGAMEAIQEAGFTTGIYGDMILISYDGVRDALELVDRGKINCEIECNPLQGELLAEVIRKLEAGETVEKEYFVEELVFTRENVKDYLPTRAY